MTDHDEAKAAVFGTEMSNDSGSVRISFSGELDVSVAPNMRRHFLHPDAVGAPQVRVDLTEVIFLDSVALGVIVAACRNIREKNGHGFSVTCPGGFARRVIEISGLIEYLRVEDGT